MRLVCAFWEILPLVEFRTYGFKHGHRKDFLQGLSIEIFPGFAKIFFLGVPKVVKFHSNH